MNEYAISWVSFHDNELNIEVVSALSYEDALLQALGKLWGEDSDAVASVAHSSAEDIKDVAFNTDGVIAALKL